MKGKWSELADVLDTDTIERLDAALPRFAAPPPSPAARAAAVDAALRALSKKRTGCRRSLWGQIKVEMRFLPLWYYMASLTVAAAGACLLLLNPSEASRLGILAGVAPLPALLGLLEVFHGADEGMAEIECACRYSPARVLSARMMIIGALSCVISVLLGVCSRFGSPWLAAGLVAIPYCLSAASGLYLSAILQGKANSAQVALAVAFANGAAAMAAQVKAEWLEAAVPACWAVMMVLSLAILLAALRATLANAGQLNERKSMQWN